MLAETTFDLQDVHHHGCTLEPMSCLNPDCSHANSGCVTYHDAIADAYCADCGEWQEQFLALAEANT